MKQVKIIGMSCQHCQAAVKKALEDLGFTSVAVDLDAGVATFTPTTAFSREQVAEAIDDAGFEVGDFA